MATSKEKLRANLEKARAALAAKRKAQAANPAHVVHRVVLKEQGLNVVGLRAANEQRRATEAAQSYTVYKLADAYADFAREDSLNQGFSPPVEERTARLSNRHRETDEDFVRRMNELERQAIDLLSGPQLGAAVPLSTAPNDNFGYYRLDFWKQFGPAFPLLGNTPTRVPALPAAGCAPSMSLPVNGAWPVRASPTPTVSLPPSGSRGLPWRRRWRSPITAATVKGRWRPCGVSSRERTPTTSSPRGRTG